MPTAVSNDDGSFKKLANPRLKALNVIGSQRQLIPCRFLIGGWRQAGREVDGRTGKRAQWLKQVCHTLQKQAFSQRKRLDISARSVEDTHDLLTLILSLTCTDR